MQRPADYADYLALLHALIGASGKCAHAMRMVHELYYALPLPEESRHDRRTQLAQLLDTEMALLEMCLRLQEQLDALMGLRREVMHRSHADRRPRVRVPSLGVAPPTGPIR
ncbi:MAG TPA: hypothetical protein VJQ45_03250 [Ktedonobacterales bacterium]|nr:hypothetical protein [Ktedonobacterales bacterium]